jgi:hypothetical protein
MRFKQCLHERWKVVARWLDTGGIRWHESECQHCGMIERERPE